MSIIYTGIKLKLEKTTCFCKVVYESNILKNDTITIINYLLTNVYLSKFKSLK